MEKAMNILQINSSLYSGNGQSSRLADEFVATLRAENPRAELVVRDLAKEPVPHLDEKRFQAFITPKDARTDEQKAIVAYSDALIDELRRAEVIVLGLPMYNFGVPSQLKSWIDHIARSGETFKYSEKGRVGLLTGKKAYVLAARGGLYAGSPADTQTAYVRQTHQRPCLYWQSETQALLDETRTDGIFPLITNDEKLSIKEVLLAYKHQPALEKRHEQFKSVLQVRPMMLKNHLRIEAFLFLYFLALLTEALIEREARQRMRKLNIKKLPLYPEERPCTAPTTERLFELFEDLRRHRLVDKNGAVQQRFYDEPSEPQRAALRLFEFSAKKYLAAAEEGGAAG